MTSTTTPPDASAEIARVRAILGELLARDAWPRERLLAHQAERLRALLAHAVARSPFYRDTLGPDAAGRPLAELPTLPKATLMEHFDRIACDPRLRRADVEAHAAGPDPGRPFGGAYRVFTTSGTTGLRGLFAFAPDEFATWTAACLRAFARIGIGPGTRLATIGAPSPLHLTRQLFAAFQAGRQGVPRVSAVTPTRELVAALNRDRPEALIGYPTVAGMLAEEQLAGRLRIEPRFGAFGAEVLTAPARHAIHRAWGFEPANVYAATEAPMIASSTPERPDLEVHEDLLIVEVVDGDGRPVPAGTPGRRLLVTNLVNFAQPLIRYELSDTVTMADGPNPAGRPYRRIAAVDGRAADTLRLPGRGGGLVGVHPSVLGAAFAQVPDVRQYQVVYDAAGLHVRTVLAGGAAIDAPERLRPLLAASIEAAGAVPPAIDVREVTALEREPGPAAKVKLVKVADG